MRALCGVNYATDVAMAENGTNNITRRRLVFGGLAAALALRAAKRKFTIAFVPGSIGIQAEQRRSIELAAQHGFESVEPFGSQLLADGVSRHLDALKKHNLQWAAANLTVSLRADEATYKEGLAKLPPEAKALRAAGVTRVGTAISSSSDSLNYLDNFRRHVRRLRETAAVLEDQGLRLGLEYLGTKHIWTRSRHAFLHSMKECRELIAETGRSNIGLVLDSWHWWTARDTVDEILELESSDVVSADLNDAPRGIEIDEQRDYERELPLATGVIDAKAFLGALLAIGYDGPIRAEPFNRRLDEMGDDEAAAKTAKAMKRAFALAG